MERMEGVDAGYLYLETPTMHMHTLKIAVLDPDEQFDDVRLTEQLLARLHLLPPFQRRVLPVPFSLNHPLWIADRPVDPARHVFRHDIPAPGGMTGLEELIGRIASTPLDRSVPLWEVHVCEGFGDGKVAVVAKIHHAVADGGAANALLTNVTDVGEEPLAGPTPGSAADPATLEPTPSRVAQIRLALTDAIRQAGTLPGLLWTTIRAVAAVLRHKGESDVAVPRPVLDVPTTSFNGALTARRSFATAALPLADIQQVRRAHEVTVNDVVLAVVAGALRRWLAARGETPSGALVAGVPVGTDEPGDPPRLGGNRVSNLFTTLATDVADPHQRVSTISRTTAESKRIQRTLGPDMLRDWVQFTPPAPLSAAMNLYSRAGLASRHPPPFNVIVSGVRGPDEIVTIAGARLADLFSVGPILEGVGLNVTAWSYDDRMNFSLLSCPDLLSDLGPLVAELGPALQELRSSPHQEG